MSFVTIHHTVILLFGVVGLHNINLFGIFTRIYESFGKKTYYIKIDGAAMFAKFNLVTFAKMNFFIVFLMCWSIFAQEQENSDSLYFRITPDSVALDVNEGVEVMVELLNKQGEIHKHPFLLYIKGNQSRKAVKVTPRTTGEPGGKVKATLIGLKPGSFEFAVRTVGPRNTRVEKTIPVSVAFPPLAKIVFVDPPHKLYQGTSAFFQTAVFDAADLPREGVEVKLRSENTAVASVDAFGNVIAHQRGKAVIVAQVDDIQSRLDIEVIKNPVTKIELAADKQSARTGDVIHLKATAKNGSGKTVADAPIKFAFQSRPADEKEPDAAGNISQDGRFVAETPGDYTLLAYVGSAMDQITVRIIPREVQMDVQVVGHGGVLDVYSSDLWVWQGVDGRDYAVTGTWEGKGHALFWDVTDPANIQLIDTAAVDARTVNDVKISEDGRICVISREGASNRKNGIVIFDVSDPNHVKKLSEFNDQMTGGVHNVFIYDNHVYAVNNSVRYDVINIQNPKEPFRVGRFELDSPGHGVHDVWIEKGIAYSSNWQDGLRLVDVGGFSGNELFKTLGMSRNPEVTNLIKSGGSPSKPMEFAHYEYPSGWNHAAFPFYSKSTGKFYVLAGDEAFPYGIGSLIDKKPEIAAGWIHFIDFTDPSNPKEVARYGVPEAGSHNFWVQGDTLYSAFYNGGLRVVDISGDLMGDLYAQGREIAWYLPMHKDGVVSNSPMVWGTQPYKGLIYFSDMNSGLWAVKLVKPKK